LKRFELIGAGQVVIERARKRAYVKRIPIKIEDKKGRGGGSLI
jgi:hypothetical protein